MSRALETVFKFINYGKSSPLNIEDYVIGLPEYNNPTLNTKISIRPKISTGQYGNFYFEYNRVQLDDLEDLVVIKGSNTRLIQLLPQLNSPASFYLSFIAPGGDVAIKSAGLLFEEDIVDLPIPTIGSTGSTLMLMKAKSNSYLFSGQTFVRVSSNT